MVIDLERICLLKSSKSWCPHIFVLLPAPPKVHSPTQTRNGAYPAPNYLCLCDLFTTVVSNHSPDTAKEKHSAHCSFCPSLSPWPAKKSLTGLVLKDLFLSIVSLWKKLKIKNKILMEKMSFASGSECAELGELALSLLVESSTVLAQLFTPEVSVLLLFLLRALLSHIAAPILATTIFTPVLLNELRITGWVLPLLWIRAYL